MWVGRLELRDFRNHRETSIVLEPGITLFVGPNGQGKTNLVEALVYLAQLSSHRVSSDVALVRSGADCGVIRAVVHHGTRDVSLALEIQAKGSNRAKVNADSVSVSAILGWLKVVLFAPEDLEIVRGDPAVRRGFIDQLTIAINPAQHRVLGQFDKLVRQRNALLKTAKGRRTAASELAAWDEEFATLSEDITNARLLGLRVLEPHFARAYDHISPGHLVAMRLNSPVNDAKGSIPGFRDAFLALLDQRREDELERGITLVGPQRDDIDLILKGLLARTHASHGEAWSLALSLKMAVAGVIRERSQAGDPVIILDDVLAELDQRRREKVVQLIRGFEQVLITAAVEADVPQSLSGKVFEVSEGEVASRG